MITLAQKKFVFKLVNDLKDKQNRAFVDLMWKKFMTLPDKDTTLKGTNEPIVADKKHLIEIIEELEVDNLVMQ